MKTYAQQAEDIVSGDRNESYGDPEEDFRGVGLMWTGLLQAKLAPGASISSVDVALMMTALKLRREAHKPKADNLIDAHGYLICLERIRAQQTDQLASIFVDGVPIHTL